MRRAVEDRGVIKHGTTPDSQVPLILEATQVVKEDDISAFYVAR
ncbi:MAG TPA: hypothetical protein VEK57_24300 [Thermoanaerobaculia bacterium]|nr:hypothetical protein [Thermoanaerobaculia bacterium]